LQIVGVNRMLPQRVDFEYTEAHLVEIRDHPHVLGHICGKERLSELHSKWIREMWDTFKDEAMQAHRGSYKTTAMAVGCVRWMLFFPDDRIAIIRKTFTDAAEVVTMISYMMDKPEVKALFYFAHGFWPVAKVRRYGQLTYNFKNTDTPEGNITAHGLDASLTGKHYDKIWCDDFVTLKDRISKAERERTKEVLREIITNIIDPGKPVMFTGTPWHREDAWEVVPITPRKYSIDDCNILTPEQVEDKRKKTTPFLFAANYKLEIKSDENALFKDPIYGKWDHMIPNAIAHLDAAYDGDHTCALTIMAQRHDGLIQGIGFVYPGNVKNWYDKIKELCKRYRARVIWNETNADKGFTVDALKARQMKVLDYPESQNKHIKICTYLYEAWGQIVWAEETDPEYMNQILDYSEGEEPDDAPDSAASLIREAFKPKIKSDSMWKW
jgi:hypothetical protein